MAGPACRTRATSLSRKDECECCFCDTEARNRPFADDCESKVRERGGKEARRTVGRGDDKARKMRNEPDCSRALIPRAFRFPSLLCVLSSLLNNKSKEMVRK